MSSRDAPADRDYGLWFGIVPLSESDMPRLVLPDAARAETAASDDISGV